MARDDETRTPPTPGAPHVLLAGGGTGGHVFPALAVGQELTARGWRVSFAGASTGLEARLVPEHGVPFHALPARPLVGQGLVGKVRALITLGVSGLAARRLVRELDADVLLGTGGYASAPAVVGAWLARRPILLLEPNAQTGVANRLLSRLAAEAVVSYETAKDALRCPVRVTGAPVRREFFDVPPFAARGRSGGQRLLVLGGSQGAQQLNRSLPPALARILEDRPTVSVVHQCGARHLEDARQAYREAGIEERVEVTAFIQDVAAAMGESQLIVSRSGALTLAEICAAGRPSLLIPLSAALGHQMDNARALAEAGAARLLPSEEVSTDSLAHALGGLLDDSAGLETMAHSARSLARPDAARIAADRVEALHAARAGRAEGGRT